MLHCLKALEWIESTKAMLQMHVMLEDILKGVAEVKRMVNKSKTSGLKSNVMKVIMCGNVIFLTLCAIVFFCGLKVNKLCVCREGALEVKKLTSDSIQHKGSCLWVTGKTHCDTLWTIRMVICLNNK